MACSRLCVKNLPADVGDAQLLRHFAARGSVTDARVMRTRNGQSRQFGFVGFSTAEEAVAAQKYYDRTFIRTKRITVEFAKKVGDEGLSRPWSKHSQGSSAHAKIKERIEIQDVKVNKVKKKLTVEKVKKKEKKVKRNSAEEGSNDVDERKKTEQADGGEENEQGGGQEGEVTLEEFLTEVAPKHRKRLWSDGMPQSMASLQPAKKARQGGNIHKQGGTTAEESEPEEEGMSDSEDSMGDSSSGTHASRSFKGTDDESDLQYLKSRMQEHWKDDDDDFGRNDDDRAVERPKKRLKSAATVDSEVVCNEANGKELHGSKSKATSRATTGLDAKDRDKIMHTHRLFVRNLPYAATEAQLWKLVEEFGDVLDVHLVTDRGTQRSKGFAYVQFAKAEDALSAAQALDCRAFQGRLIHILPADAQPDRPPQSDVPKFAGFKGEREAQRRQDAGNRAAWNTLFVRADTVAEAAAAHYGMSKAELMARDASDLGARLALGEAQVVAETKEALGEAGVDVAKLEAAALSSGKSAQAASVDRSSTALIVKNLPYTTDAKELEALLASAGAVSRFVLPPTKALALVEFEGQEGARRAFRSLAFKKYQNVPIYLEWAPKDVFASAPRVADEAHSEDEADVPKDDATADARAASEPEGDDAVKTPSIYIKNLAFSTNQEALRKLFDSAASEVGGRLLSAKIVYKRKGDSKLVSAGYGFAEVDEWEVAKHVIRKLQGHVLDGHKLDVRHSSRRPSNVKQSAAAVQPEGKSRGRDACSKLVVRNVAFEATRKDLVEVLGAFGHLKSCRLPRKFDGHHRGFAFAEFVTKREARAALEGAAGVHLYGRRLACEYARDEEGIEELRAKTLAQFHED